MLPVVVGTQYATVPQALAERVSISRQTMNAIENGVLIVHNGKIVAVGPADTPIPRDATQHDVAGQVILPGFANHPDFIRSFEMEAQLVARLEHLHIVPLYDYWRDPDGAYLVMRRMRGGSLQQALQEGPFDLKPA
ncbi:MAG: hypothetical protein ABFS46_08510, partial [Myxococcota bacterium]